MKQLKAKAYDLISLIEKAKMDLDAVNRKIIELMQGEKNEQS